MKATLMIGSLFLLQPLSVVANIQYDTASKALRYRYGASDSTSPDGVWSGALSDLKEVVANAEKLYGFENNKHLGRNATMLVPATKEDMERVIHGKNESGWYRYWADGFHNPEAEKDVSELKALAMSFYGTQKKYVNRHGGEVVYNNETGEIVKDEHLGTRNFGKSILYYWGDHREKDVKTHEKNDQYKYVGILYEIDPVDSEKFYIVDGQIGKRMTNRQVGEFPTTLSNMWKDMGLVCVESDANNVVPPDIDTSELEAVFKMRIELLKTIVANGGSPSDGDRAAINANAEEGKNAIVKIVERINALDVSDEEKKTIGESMGKRLEPYGSEIMRLQREVGGEWVETLWSPEQIRAVEKAKSWGKP